MGLAFSSSCPRRARHAPEAEPEAEPEVAKASASDTEPEVGPAEGEATPAEEAGAPLPEAATAPSLPAARSSLAGLALAKSCSWKLYVVWRVPGQTLDIRGIHTSLSREGRAAWAHIARLLPHGRYAYSDGTRLTGQAWTEEQAIATYTREAAQHGAPAVPRFFVWP